MNNFLLILFLSPLLLILNDLFPEETFSPAMKENQTDRPLYNRPQEPKPPYPYLEENVTFMNVSDNVSLSGTLTLPHTQPPFPAVLLIPGSGRQDRNEALPQHNHLFQVAKTGSVSEYAQIEETLFPLTLNTISAWILKRP